MTEQRSINSRKGRMWNIDDNGFLQNDASLNKIQPEFLSVIEEAKATYLEQLSPYIHSLYLTGSISRGIAIPGVSDLDAFAVLKKSSEIAIPNLSAIKTVLLRSHTEVTDIQMEIWKWEDLKTIQDDVQEFKGKLREEVDRQGGVSELARKTGIPQPSLSRFFSSSSKPRRTTLYKIAKALNLPESAIGFKWTR